LRQYICRDHQELGLGLKHLTRIVRGDGRASNLKREADRRRLTVDLAVMDREERLSELLEYTTLASHVFGVLVDRARIVEVTLVVSTICNLWSRFDLMLCFM
jgi:hypothetical protein